MVEVVHAVIVVVLLALLVQTWLGTRTLPRLARMPAPARRPRVAVLVPARDEASRIAESVRAWTCQDYPHYEVIVYDDESTDDTAARAAAAGRVRVLRGDGLPDGWRGKPHACHRLRGATRAEVLVFADADVVPRPDAVRRAVGALERLGADALSALPAHTSPSVVVLALVAIQNWAPPALVPAWCPGATRRRRFAVLNGQFFVVRARTYDAVGGFAAVRDAVGEDTVLGRRLVAHGHRLALVDGAEVLRCRSYARPAEAWRGTARNLATAFFGSPWLLAAAAIGAVLLYVAPAVALAGGGLGIGGPGWPWLPVVELGLGIASRALTDARAGYPRALALLHPFAMLALAGMLGDALRRRLTGAHVEWRGRRYRVA